MKNRYSRFVGFTVLVASLSFLVSLAEARVTRVQITSRVVVADGASFGDTGPYEKLRGTVFFEVNPSDPRNAVVFDLDKGPAQCRRHGGILGRLDDHQARGPHQGQRRALRGPGPPPPSSAQSS